MTAIAATLAIVALTSIAEDPPQTWLDFLTEGGLLGGAVLTIWALLTERLVPGRVFRRELDEERARTTEALALLRQALGTNERAVERIK